jgi:D-glycero-alpha-D-manno-heptose 1-phosphate guanylyltransferase
MSSIREAIVLAGGLGTRLRGIVSDVPKALAPIAGRPFLDWLLDDLRRQGITRVILATGYGSELIEHRYRAGHPGMSVVISREEKPLGTGGAIRLACRHASDEQVLVVNGDTFAAWHPAPLVATAASTRAPITVGLKYVIRPDRYGTVILAGSRVVSFREKEPLAEGLVNAGLYLITPKAIPWPAIGRFSFEHDVLRPGCRQDMVAGAVLAGPFIDIGIPEAYAEAQIVIPQWTSGVDC